VRADRLLAELLTLQARGRVTAAYLAEELEVSERTIYRDMEALQIAGVPVVALAGPGGGYSLYGDWRTDLTGLTGDELTALSVVMVAGPVSDAAARRRLQSALAKIAAALPASLRREVEHLQRRIHIEPSPAPGSAQDVLASLAGALQRGLGVELVLRGPFDTELTRSGKPLGLVAAAGTWHLVWAPHGCSPRADRVADVLSVGTGPLPEDVPADVDLVGFWDCWKARQARRVPGVPVRLRISPALLPMLRRGFGSRLEVESEAPPVVRIGFDSIDGARAAILALGGAAEVLQPEALRRTVADFAEQAAAVYRG
jgi:predicted DNA-binding transcriptional regulator YafY